MPITVKTAAPRAALLARRSILRAGMILPTLALSARAQPMTGILRYGLSAYPPNLQPWVRTGASAGTIKALIHRSLVTYDSNGELRCELADTWSFDGGGACVFKLRKGALFHNGEKVTDDDIKWSMEAIAAEKSTAYMRG